MSVRRAKMCAGKVSFRTIGAANRVANKFGQNVYECPICFCFHCTSLSNWRDEFVGVEIYRRVLRECENLRKLEASRKETIKKNNALRNENFRLKKELRLYGIFPEWLIEKQEPPNAMGE